MMPKVSVLCPVYNGERHLADAITSVLSQTFRDFELILYDDGSMDHSFAIMKNFAAQDSRIKIVCGGENRGSLYARNELIKLAIGEFCAWIDQSDMMEINFLSDAMILQEKGNFDLIQFGNPQCCDENGNIVMELTKYDGFVYMGNSFLVHFLPYLSAYRYSLWSKLIRTSVMKQATFRIPAKRYSMNAHFFAINIFLSVKKFMYYNGKAYYMWRGGKEALNGTFPDVSLERLREMCEVSHDVLAHWLDVLRIAGRYNTEHIKACCENCLLQETAEMVFRLPEEQRAEGEAMFRRYFCADDRIPNQSGPSYPGLAARLTHIMRTGIDYF